MINYSDVMETKFDWIRLLLLLTIHMSGIKFDWNRLLLLINYSCVWKQSLIGLDCYCLTIHMSGNKV